MADAAKAPFLWGSKQQWVQIAQIAATPGLAAPAVKIPKNGYLSKLRFRFSGAMTITTAGSAPAAGLGPKLYNIISNYALTFNGGFQYRDLDGDSLWMLNNLQVPGNNDPVIGYPYTAGAAQLGFYQNYAPQTASAQNINFTVSDDVSLNTQLNGDTFLLAAQARNADIILQITFGANPTGTTSPTTIGANTEVGTYTGTLYVEGLYMLDPDYSQFMGPDLTDVQQILTDASYTNVSAGADNYVPIVPINGPQYTQLAFRPIFNNVPDPGGALSNCSRFRIRLNNNQDMYDYTQQALQMENVESYGRLLPSGWFVFDWLDDIGLPNTCSPVGRNIVSTEKIASLNLIVTVNSGVTVTNSVIKLLKRIKTPAVSV